MPHKLRSILALGLWLLLSLVGRTQAATPAEADALLQGGKTDEAIKAYEDLTAGPNVDTALIHNLAVAYLAKGEKALAFIELARAYFLDPSSATIKEHLNNLAETELALSPDMKREIHNMGTALIWRNRALYSGLILFWTSLGLLVFPTSQGRRHVNHVFGGTGLFCGLLALSFAWYFYRTAPQADDVWLIQDTQLYAAPSESAPSLASLKTLDQARIVTEKTSWNYVTLRNQLRGWVPRSQIRKLY